jgi:DNA-binding transcriptional LysR family regulator
MKECIIDTYTQRKAHLMTNIIGGRSTRAVKVGLRDQAGPLAIIEPGWLLFLNVAAAGSLSKAAALLNVPQSVVSRNISQLEQRCGERLFNRTGRGVVLTEFGEQLLPRISQLVADANMLTDDIRNVHGQPSGEVLLGLLPSAVRQIAGSLFAKVKEVLPGVHLHLVEGASAMLEEQLREGRLDMAIVFREDELAVGDEQVLIRVPLYLVGPRNDPLMARPEIELSALCGLPLIVPGRPHLLRARLDHLATIHGLNLNVAVEVDSIYLQYEVAAVGGGYAIASVAPDWMGERLTCCRIVRPTLERFIVLAESLRRPATKATRAVCEIIRQMDTF